MEFTEIISNLNASPVYEKYCYEDKDHISWELLDKKCDDIEVSACVGLSHMGDSDKYIDMVNELDRGYRVHRDADCWCIRYHTILSKTTDVYTEIVRISASILAISLMLERMCRYG